MADSTRSARHHEVTPFAGRVAELQMTNYSADIGLDRYHVKGKQGNQ
jgi:hypothetical protein